MEKKMEAIGIMGILSGLYREYPSRWAILEFEPLTNRLPVFGGNSSVALRWTPHPVIVTMRDNRDDIRVLLYSQYTTIAGWGVLLM